MERELPFNPYEVCQNIAPQRTVFRVDDIQIVFQPQFAPSSLFMGTLVYFRKVIEGKLHAASNIIPREELDDETTFNAKFMQLLDTFAESLRRES